MEPLRRSVNPVDDQPTPLGKLPDFLLIEVFSFLSSFDVCTLRLVSRRWREIAEDRLIWKQLFKKQFPLTFPKLSPDLDFLEVYGSVQRRIRVTSQIRFNKYRVEEERKILHPRFKWPWVFGVNGRSLILWNVETRKTHLLQLQIFFTEERPFLQPLAIKKGLIYVTTSRPVGPSNCTLHEVNILKGTVNQSYRPPEMMGRFLHFKKMALYYVVHNVVHVWSLTLQLNQVLIQKNNRILSMNVKGDCIAIVREGGIDLHHRVSGDLIHSMDSTNQFIFLGKNINRGELVFTLNQVNQTIEAREVKTLRQMATYHFRVISQGFNQSHLSEVVVDEDFLVVKVVHTQNPPVPGSPERESTLEFFDIETGSSISVIKLEKEPFGLFFKNGKIFYQVRDNSSGKEKIKTEWVDFSNEKSLKRKGCVIS